MSTSHTQKFNKQLKDAIKSIKNDLKDRIKKNKTKKVEYLEIDFIRELKYKRDFKLRKKRDPEDVNVSAYNEVLNPFKEELLAKYNLCKEEFYSNIYIDVLIDEHLEGLIDKHKSKYEENNDLYKQDEELIKNLSVPSSLSFLVQFYSINDFLDEYYEHQNVKSEKGDSIKSTDKEIYYNETGLIAKEHILLWEAFIENKIFIQNPKFSPIKNKAQAFEILTGFRSNTFYKKRTDLIGSSNSLNYSKVIERLKMVIQYLEEKK